MSSYSIIGEFLNILCDHCIGMFKTSDVLFLTFAFYAKGRTIIAFLFNTNLTLSSYYCVCPLIALLKTKISMKTNQAGAIRRLGCGYIRLKRIYSLPFYVLTCQDWSYSANANENHHEKQCFGLFVDSTKKTENRISHDISNLQQRWLIFALNK